MIGLLKRFRRDQQGVSAIEFAFIAPVLIAGYFGLAEMSGAMLAERKASLIASEVGDLVAQDTAVATSDVTDIFSVGATIMAPLPTTTMNMRITSIGADTTGKIFTVQWSCVNSGATWPKLSGTITGVPTGIVPASGSVIRSDVQYTYSSPVSDFIKIPLTFNETFYLSPRQSTSVTGPSSC